MTDDEAKVVQDWVTEAWDAGYGAAMAWSIKAIGGNVTNSPVNPYKYGRENDA
jgi:hypothetical protein